MARPAVGFSSVAARTPSPAPATAPQTANRVAFSAADMLPAAKRKKRKMMDSRLPEKVQLHCMPALASVPCVMRMCLQAASTVVPEVWPRPTWLLHQPQHRLKSSLRLFKVHMLQSCHHICRHKHAVISKASIDTEQDAARLQTKPAGKQISFQFHSSSHVFHTYAGQAQQAQLGTYWSNQLSPTSLVLCYPKPFRLCMKGASCERLRAKCLWVCPWPLYLVIALNLVCGHADCGICARVSAVHPAAGV